MRRRRPRSPKTPLLQNRLELLQRLVLLRIQMTQVAIGIAKVAGADVGRGRLDPAHGR